MDNEAKEIDKFSSELNQLLLETVNEWVRKNEKKLHHLDTVAIAMMGLHKAITTLLFMCDRKKQYKEVVVKKGMEIAEILFPLMEEIRLKNKEQLNG